MKECQFISPYLYPVSSPVIVEPCQNVLSPYCTSEMHRGNDPVDGGHLIFTESQMKSFLEKEPLAKPYFKKYCMGMDYLQNRFRWCLWLADAHPDSFAGLNYVWQAVERVKAFRLASQKKATRDSAKTPWLFQAVKRTSGTYLALPKLTSGKREYIPAGFLDGDVVPGTSLFTMKACLYDFGVLMSKMHMAWVKIVSGRMKSDYSYSNHMVFNTFPWPNVSKDGKDEVSALSGKILFCRKDSGKCLASLYDPETMPMELRWLHNELDVLVDSLYGIKSPAEDDIRIGILLALYKSLIRKQNSADIASFF